MINRVVLVGRLTKDPELRYTANGIAVASFTLAVNRPFSNQQGNREADFINCVVWRKQAENVANFLKKGSQAGVDGRIQTRSFDNNEGRRVFMTEVVAESVQFLEPRGSGGSGGGGQYAGAGGGYGESDNSGYQNTPNQGGFGQGNQGSQPNQGGYGDQGSQNDDPFAGDGKPIDINDDDLPF
ncbi:single-stranded DNA-binding protein [Salipaludibacillus agaradhaerens]|uniref:single-stranded DNA-binding protein n=1 Tax=Salipaludibacillus agaradhaerens TaxID=76935 RepID=UPI002150D1B5|nr:single-stranded DNA-binding protein [Salipaludibacillus agaradhaerens]MCR6108537.1 single-stranded DNA-binding protein [Salipaludibacillus agaradhaerens]MCR6120558.1 single-stranded DNA-binding protein [Salipaludibacillus agaradhaerens]UJW59565.1 single-stranded DNA-binding protein [Bacillus sp. A116_S68]